MQENEIATQRLRLRTFIDADIEAYNAVRRKPAVARFLPSFRGADEAEIRARTAATIAAFQAHWAELPAPRSGSRASLVPAGGER